MQTINENATNRLIPAALGGDDIRVFTIGGKSWFVGADVCHALGLKQYAGGLTPHYGKLDADEKQTTTWGKLHPSLEFSYPQGGRNAHTKVTLINESGFYRLVFRSDKPAARAFQDWVARDVLPAIRKEGAYVMGEEKVATGELSADEFARRARDILQTKLGRLTAQRDAMLRLIKSEETPTGV